MLAKEKYGLRGRELAQLDAQFIPFSATTRMSGLDMGGRSIRKGAADALARYLQELGSSLPNKVRDTVEMVALSGATPLVVAENGRALGVIEGKLVAMTDDGTNDAPALAQADVGIAMNSGPQVAKEAGNMADLDSDPTKLIEIVAIGKHLLMTRGALTTSWRPILLRANSPSSANLVSTRFS